MSSPTSKLPLAKDDVCLLLKVDQSDIESNPSDDALAVGMFSVWTLPVDVIPKPPFDDVVANVWEAEVRPLSEVIAEVKP